MKKLGLFVTQRITHKVITKRKASDVVVDLLTKLGLSTPAETIGLSNCIVYYVANTGSACDLQGEQQYKLIEASESSEFLSLVMFVR